MILEEIVLSAHSSI